MLRWITEYLIEEYRNDDTQDFVSNVVANMISNRIEERRFGK